jgi:hypothetical protein
VSETVVWIDPDGVTTTFSRVEFDIRGRWFPTLALEEDTVPGQSGQRLRAVRHGAMELAIAVWVRAATASALRVALRAAVRALDPTRGVGSLRVTSPVGDQRELACICVDGLSMVERLGESSTPTDQRLVLAFKAHEPYWTATSDVVTDFTVGGSPATFFPFFPLRLTASEIAVDTTVTNGGDVEAWPVWTITGPGSSIVLRNLTTGKELTISGLTLGAGETMTIDTRPGHKTIIRQDGTNLWPYVVLSSSTSGLWSLTDGSNSVRMEMATTTSASALRLAYRPRYLSP